MTPCDFCDGTGDLRERPASKRKGPDVAGWSMLAGRACVNVDYCPWCGRRLDGLGDAHGDPAAGGESWNGFAAAPVGWEPPSVADRVQPDAAPSHPAPTGDWADGMYTPVIERVPVQAWRWRGGREDIPHVTPIVEAAEYRMPAADGREFTHCVVNAHGVQEYLSDGDWVVQDDIWQGCAVAVADSEFRRRYERV